MYRRLYEEERKISASTHPNTVDLTGIFVYFSTLFGNIFKKETFAFMDLL